MTEHSALGMTDEQAIECRRLKSEGLTREDIARRMGVKLQFVRFMFKRPSKTHGVLETMKLGSDAKRLSVETGLPYHTIYSRIARGDYGDHLVRPAVKFGPGSAFRKRHEHTYPEGHLYGSSETPVLLSDLQIEEVRTLRASKQYQDLEIAQRYGVTLRYIQAVKPLRGKAGVLTCYWVGDERMTVPQIAKLAGTSRAAIYQRIQRGVRGLALASPAHAVQRKTRKDKIPAEVRAALVDRYASRRGVLVKA